MSALVRLTVTVVVVVVVVAAADGACGWESSVEVEGSMIYGAEVTSVKVCENDTINFIGSVLGETTMTYIQLDRDSTHLDPNESTLFSSGSGLSEELESDLSSRLGLKSKAKMLAVRSAYGEDWAMVMGVWTLVDGTSLLVLSLEPSTDKATTSLPTVTAGVWGPVTTKTRLHSTSNVGIPGTWVLAVNNLTNSDIREGLICPLPGTVSTPADHAHPLSYDFHSATMECDEGYGTFQPVKLTCNRGTWRLNSKTPLWMACKELSCPTIDLDPNGTAGAKPTDKPPVHTRVAGGNVSFHCDQYFIPEFTTGKCHENGSWSWPTAPKGPVCHLDTSVICPTPPPEIANAYIHTSPPYNLSSSAHYSCLPLHYTTSRNLIATCTIQNKKISWQLNSNFSCLPLTGNCSGEGGFLQDPYELPLVIGCGVVTVLCGVFGLVGLCCRRRKKGTRRIAPTVNINFTRGQIVQKGAMMSTAARIVAIEDF